MPEMKPRHSGYVLLPKPILLETETQGRSRYYHVKMVLDALSKLAAPEGDTRAYLDLDFVEREILRQLLTLELERIRIMKPDAAAYWET